MEDRSNIIWPSGYEDKPARSKQVYRNDTSKATAPQLIGPDEVAVAIR